MTDTQKLSFREKSGYALGDGAANFVFQLLLVFQAGFYTDLMGVGAASLGTLLLVVRLSDAFVDPLVGVLADRTTHRWGKFRPWVLWSAVPFAVVFWAAFTVPPGLGSSGRFAYAAATYTALMIIYSINNVPYSALMGVMTSSSSERTSLSSYRFVAGICAAFVVQGFTLPLVGKLGGGDDVKGWSLTVGIFAVVSVVFFVITFLTVKERIRPPADQTRDLRRDVADLQQNRAWLAMFVMTFFVFTTLSLRGGSYFYYFTYYVDSTALSRFIETLGLVPNPEEAGSLSVQLLDLFGLVVKPDADPSKVGFSVFNMVGQLVNIGGIFLAAPLAARFGKKAVFTTGLIGATVVQFAFVVPGPRDVGAMFVLNVLSSLAYGPTIPLLWAMIGDTADYAEWKTRRRATGFIFAGIVFALKAGLGLGGAVSGWLLAFYGYTPETATTADVLSGIRAMASAYSALPFAIGVACMFFYPITKRLNLQMSRELDERRAACDPAGGCGTLESPA